MGRDLGDHKEPLPNSKGSEMGEGFLQPTSQLCLRSLERGVWTLGVGTGTEEARPPKAGSQGAGSHTM